MSKKKKCQYTDVISPPLDELLKLAPGNPTIRTQVLNEIKISLPDDVQTYDAIVEWIEDNYDAKLGFDTEEVVPLDILLTVKRTGTAKRFVQYDTTGGVKANVRLLDIVRLFRRLSRDKRGWSRFREDCFGMIADRVLEQQKAVDSGTLVNMVADANREWEHGEPAALHEGLEYETVEAETLDIQNSNRLMDAIYLRLSQLYPADVSNMENRD